MATLKKVVGAPQASGKDTAKQVLALIEQLTDPKKMSKREYLTFCEEVCTDIESRLEAVRDEVGNE